MPNVALLHNPVLEYRPDSSVPVNIAAVAARIAGVLGGELVEQTDLDDSGAYYVPFAAVEKPLADQYGITGQGDLYGGIVVKPQHADKAILHHLTDMDAVHPDWYSLTFARDVQDVVLPGYTTFTDKDSIKAFDLMQAQGLGVRFKDPSNTGGLGQQFIGNKRALESALYEHGDKIRDAGAIFEADLTDHQTVTIGYVDLNDDVYTWFGKPYDVQHNGMTRFGGNELTVVRGDFDSLDPHSPDAETKLAILQTKKVFEAYKKLGTIITRGTFDAVQGLSRDGNFISGITDPSLRPSASSAAEVRAIEVFAENAHAQTVTTRLDYDYAKVRTADQSRNRELFVEHNRMNIFVEVVDIN